MALPIQIVERLARLNIRPEEVDERFVRGAGPGGQKINKTSSTVWLRHDATGTEVRCQAQRSQSANRLKAWEDLCEKLEAQARAIRVGGRSKNVKQSGGERDRRVGRKNCG